MRRVAERIALVPRFSWRLQNVPMGIDEPYWVESSDFDVREHIHRIAVPSPGSRKELGELAGHLFARPLDRRRPLWEIWFIEGVEGGRCAIFVKCHHCLMDGQASAGLVEVLFDLAPDATGPANVAAVYDERAPIPPTGRDQLENALRNGFDRTRKAFGHLGAALEGALQQRFGRPDEEAALIPGPADVPRVSFNGVIGPRRSLVCSSVSLERVKQIKKHFDVTINDVVLELVASATRRYLHERDERPEKPLVAAVPVSRRAEGDASLGNQVANMSVHLATDLERPEERLLAISRSAKAAKAAIEEGKSFDVLEVVQDSFAPVVANAIMRLSSTPAAIEHAPLPGNLIVSNVRLTPIPLYVAGAQIEATYPMSVIQNGSGLNVTVVSYLDRIEFGFTVDPDLVPDADLLAERVPLALEELELAASGVQYRQSQATPVPREPEPARPASSARAGKGPISRRRRSCP